MGKRKKLLCPVCDRRKPRWECPVLGKALCSRCCGERRSPSNCPSDCEYFKVQFNRYDLPLYKCLDLAFAGMHSILLARERRDGSLIVAGFLADTHGNGLKDCFVRKCSKQEFQSMIGRGGRQSEEEFREIPLEECQRIVKAALRINPVSGYLIPSGFQEAKRYLGDLEQVEVTGSVFRCMLCGGSLDEKTDQLMAEHVGDESMGFLLLCERCNEKKSSQ